jgi:anti-anti-sigma regulatory factor
MARATNSGRDLCEVHKYRSQGGAGPCISLAGAYYLRPRNHQHPPDFAAAMRPHFADPIRPDFAVAIRPGEHACCRFAHADDRRRLALAFVRAGLARGHRVAYLSGEDDATRFVADLAALDDRVDEALERGQLNVRPALGEYIPNGTFDPADMRAVLRDEHAQALADGYSGLSMAGDMSWALLAAPGLDQLAPYEHEVATMMDADVAFLCIYDHGRFAAGTLAQLAESHGVDVSPELAQVGRVGYLAASRVLPGPILRLCGELDFECAEAIAGVLDAHYHGTLRLDLADLSYVDVTGLRALRGKNGQRLAITSASQPVRRLLGLLGWDTDPAIEIAEAT